MTDSAMKGDAQSRSDLARLFTRLAEVEKVNFVLP